MTEDIPDIPGYTIESVLGEGGMARVYLAVQHGFDRPVALKIIAQELADSPEFGKRFLREAKIVGRLSHPNIVPVYDVGEHQGMFYLAMELLTEGDLRAKLATPVSEAFALNVIRQLAGALGYAHDKGFIHRDVKPDNVLFRDGETAVLTDFGIARSASHEEDDTQITKVQSVIGSPKFMSPEQSMGHDLDGRTDIYSLGIILFQMLVGALPYSGRNLTEISVQRYKEKLPQLPPAQAHLQPLLNRLLAYEREDRFENCAALLAALDSLPTEPPVVPSDPTIEMPTADQRPVSIDQTVVRGAERVEPERGKPARGWMAAMIVGIALLGVVMLLQRDDTEPAVTIAAPVSDSAAERAVSEAPVSESPVSEPAVSESTTIVKSELSEQPNVSSADTQPVPVTAPGAAPVMSDPAPEEFFAFYDAANSALPGAAEQFVISFPDSVFTPILRMKLTADAALLLELEEQSESGSKRAQLILSELYATGWGVDKDPAKALQLATMAASDGWPFAQYLRSTRLLDNADNDKARRDALREMEKAAQGGFYLAQTVLANHLFEGKAVARDVDESLRMLEAAATQGDRNALFNLGIIYDRGMNLPEPDTQRAQRYFEQAARLGHPSARDNLADPI